MSSENKPCKRIDIVSIKMVKEDSMMYKNRYIRTPGDAAELVREILQDSDREKLIVVCLDTKNQPTAINICSIGSLNSSIVHPREVFKVAILSNSASVIIAHNHPSNDLNPSQEDAQVTRRLLEAGKLLGIDVIDHLIVGINGNYLSLKERGLI